MSRSLTIAKNKKIKKLKELEILKTQMIENNIDIDMINKYMDEQCVIINKIYYDKIEQSKIEQSKNNIKIKITKENNKKKEIDFLFKNKLVLETNNANSEYINYYVNKQFNEIKKKYN